MINLEDVSIDLLLTSLKKDNSKNDIISEAHQLLLKYNLKNYSELEHLINNGNIDNEYLKKELLIIKNNILYANEMNYQPMIFKCDNYKETNVDKKTLKITDRKTFCG